MSAAERRERTLEFRRAARRRAGRRDAAKGAIDPVLAAVVVALIGFGVVMVYSASAVEATVEHHDPQFFLKRQAAYARRVARAASSRSRASTTTGSTSSRTRCSRRRRLCSSRASSASVTRAAARRAGSRSARSTSSPPRWRSSRSSLARLLAREEGRAREDASPSASCRTCSMAGVFMLLCLKQPDFGSAVVLLFLTFTLLFVAGAQVGYILGASILGARRSARAAIRFSAYRYARYLAWLNMDEHRQDLAYQPFQSVMSFGSGGPTGSGLGRGLQTLYLPEAHTDFISAIIGEELGFIGDPRALRRVPRCSCSRGVRAALARAGRLRQLPRVRHLDDVRRAGAREPRGRAGHPADQGPHAAVRELRRLVAARERGGGRHPAQHLAPAATSATTPTPSDDAVQRPSATRRRRQPTTADEEARR